MCCAYPKQPYRHPRIGIRTEAAPYTLPVALEVLERDSTARAIGRQKYLCCSSDVPTETQ